MTFAACDLAGQDAAAASRGEKTPEEGADAEAAEDDAIPVRAGVVARDRMTSGYATSATLRADRKATITARTQGVLRKLAVEEGDEIEEGQILAVLEDDEQRIALARAKATLETRRREYERAASLHAQGLVSDEEYDAKSRDARDAAQEVSLTELELSRTTIRAPFGGVVLLRHLDVGATVTNGTPVYDLADLRPLYADVNVPERHVVKLAPGQEVRLVADATGDTVPGTIERIAPAVDPATGTVKVTVATRGETGLRPGTFVRVEIVTDTHADAIVVPRSALVAEGRHWFLFRLHEDGETVEKLEASLGFEEGERVEILAVVGDASPLAPGDRIVITGAAALSDGARVAVIPDEPSASPQEGESSSDEDDAGGTEEDGSEDAPSRVAS